LKPPHPAANVKRNSKPGSETIRDTFIFEIGLSGNLLVGEAKNREKPGTNYLGCVNSRKRLLLRMNAGQKTRPRF
jgi:hypothetical protein